MPKALVLLSGGLDSILAAKLMLEQGIEVEAINFKTVFCNCTSKGKSCSAAQSASRELDIPLKVFEISKEYFEIVRNPEHGYGKNLNPCLDCRIFIYRKAKEYMANSGASFVVTGEVLGERPMSQRRDAMMLIERESGLKGLIVRPLSATFFEPTTPEKEGIVDRAKMLSISGRCRKPQIALAEQLSIKDYPCPSGGCLLTYKDFANKVRDLMKNSPEISINDIEMLKTGRYFRINKSCFLAVGRNEAQNERLEKLAKEGDIHFQAKDATGPVGIGRGQLDKEAIDIASSIIAYYSDRKDDEALKISHKKTPVQDASVVEIPPAQEKLILFLRI